MWIYDDKKRFPRLSSRGPIEAPPLPQPSSRFRRRFRDYQVAAPLKLGSMGVNRPQAREFPRLSSRGPIEAGHCADVALEIGVFPRLSSRGPIEALVGLGPTLSAKTGFRDYQVAAPLKQMLPKSIRSSGRMCFRDYQVAAPLKLTRIVGSG